MNPSRPRGNALRNRGGVFLVAAFLLAASCGASFVSPAAQQAVEAKAAREETLQSQALVQAQEPYQTLRYNPAPESCACPAFEVLVAERWRRLRLTPRAMQEEDFDQFRAHSVASLEAGDLGRIFATGELDDDPIPVCPNGTLGLEMQVDAVFDSPPELAVP